jgi:hypothetical protein
MIRACCLFYELAPERPRKTHYLIEAQRIAAAVEKKWFRESDGAVTDVAPFAHLLCESLLYLSKVDGNDARVERVRRALMTLHDTYLTPQGLYPKRWDSPMKQDEPARLLDQASAARALLVMSRFNPH